MEHDMETGFIWRFIGMVLNGYQYQLRPIRGRRLVSQAPGIHRVGTGKLRARRLQVRGFGRWKVGVF